MSGDCLKLTAYFGERDRTDEGFVADAFSDICERHALRTSLVMRGVAGFGAGRRVHTDRRLTPSEDLPVVAVAVDERERIEAAHREVVALRLGGAVTLERARMAATVGGPTKLTVYLGRQERAGGQPAYRAIVDELHRAGVAGATVLLGVDGTAHGERRRARFLSRNADVPLMVISVGDGDRIAAVAQRLEAMLARPLITYERIQVCKRDGTLMTPPDRARDGVWQKLMVYASEQAQHDGRPLYAQLMRRLREAGAAGATSLRGIWGYHGDHLPHGDTFWQLRRRVPVVTVIVDTPDRIDRWFEIIDEVTSATGLVTSEMVPAYLHRQPRD